MIRVFSNHDSSVCVCVCVWVDRDRVNTCWFILSGLISTSSLLYRNAILVLDGGQVPDTGVLSRTSGMVAQGPVLCKCYAYREPPFLSLPVTGPQIQPVRMIYMDSFV